MDRTADGRLKISGIKLSGRWIQIDLPSGGGCPASRLFGKLAERRVNVTLITFGAAGDAMAGSCCIAAEDAAMAAPVLEDLAPSLQVIPGIGALTVFPHRSSFDLFASMLSAFARSRLPVYAVASSLAALTFTTDYDRLDDAAASVLEGMVLPENHAPFRAEFKVRQI